MNAQGGLYDNCLHIASRFGKEAVVRLLLDNGANVNAPCGYYGDALQNAARNGHANIVELLLAKGANVNAKARNI